MSLVSRIAQAFKEGYAADPGRPLSHRAPQVAASFVLQALDRAVAGAGPFDGAAVVAARAGEGRGDADAVRTVIEQHVRLAGAQGFVTSLGGLVTMPVSVPANLGGLAVVQCRLAAAIAHHRGHDLADPRVRNAVLVCLLGEEKVDRLVERHSLPGPPMALATAPVSDPDLVTVVANEVAAEVVSRVAGKRVATTVGRRTPLVGGVVGAGADGWSTWRVGRYAEGELLPRRRR